MDDVLGSQPRTFFQNISASRRSDLAIGRAFHSFQKHCSSGALVIAAAEVRFTLAVLKPDINAKGVDFISRRSSRCANLRLGSERAEQLFDEIAGQTASSA